MSRTIHLFRQLTVVACFWTSAATSDAAVITPALVSCPATREELRDFIAKLELQSQTPDLESHDSKNFYVPESVKVLGAQPLEFRVDLIRGQVTGLNVKLDGPFQQYAAALQRTHGKDTMCNAERCRWTRPGVPARGELVYVELTQYLGGYDSNLGCGYIN